MRARILPVSVWALAGAASAAMVACEEEPSEEAAAPAPLTEVREAPTIGRTPGTESEQDATARAQEAAQELGRALKTRLLAAITEGPEAAAQVCATEAQALTTRVAGSQPARVGRSSLRLRNPENRGPTWVTSWLQAQGEGSAEGVSSRVGISGEPPVARFIGPIAVEGPCLVCHGEAGTLSEPVRAVIAARYPEDQATGYAVGDLRGAVWAELPLE